MNTELEIAQAVRRSHCDRKGAEHECVGELTVRRGEVILNCPLCGPGELCEPWNQRAYESLRAIFAQAGVDFSALAKDAQNNAMAEYERRTKPCP